MSFTTNTKKVEKVFVSWDAFGKQVDTISEYFGSEVFTRVVGISRGGLPLGVALSHKLNLPFTSVGVSSYNNQTNEQETLVCHTPDVVFEDWTGVVLCVDDISDSGHTLQFLYDKVHTSARVEKLVTATLYYKECSVFQPDFYVEKTDKWIVFPWEVR